MRQDDARDKGGSRDQKRLTGKHVTLCNPPEITSKADGMLRLDWRGWRQSQSGMQRQSSASGIERSMALYSRSRTTMTGQAAFSITCRPVCGEKRFHPRLARLLPRTTRS